MSLKVIITNVITDVISNVINLLFTPIDVTGLTFWTKAKILARSGWPTTTDQLKNEVGAPHLQLNTGSGIQLVSATSDYIDTNIPLGTVTSFVKFARVKAVANNSFQSIIDSRNSGTTGVILGINTTSSVNTFYVDINGQRLSLPTITTLIWFNIYAGLDSVNNKMFIEVLDMSGNVIQRADQTYTGGVISEITANTQTQRAFFEGLNFNGQIESFAVWKNTTVDYTDLSYYKKWINEPQLEADSTALMFYRLAEGKYLDGDIAINEGTGGNGTVLTTGVATYDMAVNGLADGFQLGLSGYNITGGRVTIANEPEGSTDISGAPILLPWREGTLNLGSYGHLGAHIGSTNSAIDGDNRSFIFLIDYANNGASQYLLSNRADDDGLDIRLNVNDKFLVANEVAGAFLSTDVAASVSEEKTRILVTLALNGDCAVYLETLGTAFNTAYTSKNLGAPGDGSDQPKLGIKSDDTDPFTSPINYIQVNSVIDLATANQIADYMEIQFSKI